MPEFETHKVTKTKVVKQGDAYAVTFIYDDGTGNRRRRIKGHH